MNVRKAKHGWIFTLVFTLISIAYVFADRAGCD